MRYNKRIYDIEENLKKEIWTTSNMERIPVKKMGFYHIHNAINCLKYVLKDLDKDVKREWLSIFKKELKKRKKK